MASLATTPAISSDFAFRLELTWNVEFNITDKNLNVEAKVDERAVPFDSKPWTFLARWNTQKQRLNIGIRFGVAKEADVGRSVALTFTLFWIGRDGTAHNVAQAEFGPAPFPETNAETGKLYSNYLVAVAEQDWEETAAESSGDYDPRTHRAYRLVVMLEQGIDDILRPALDTQAEALAERTSDVHLEQLPHNVRLFFPRAHAQGAELWAKFDFLSRSSPYLKDLLSSDFAESKPRRSKRARTGGIAEVAVAAGEAEEKDYPDSDDETDAFLFSKNPPNLERSSEGDEVFYRQVTVTQTAFSTYHAILVYLQSGHIHFIPLSSSFPSATTSPSRDDYLAKSLTEKPLLPLPVSPKSAYRLAHLLQLEDLQKRSLDTLRSSLSTSNAAVELFSPTSIAYDDLRKVILEYDKEEWQEVQQSEGWKEKTAAVKGGDCTAPEAAVLMEAFEAIAETA